MKKYQIQIVLLAYLLAGIFTIVKFDGTGDSGDSIMHYLFARYSFQHPALFFDHWAKPLFVLFSSPFAQFGFTGIKVFNLLVSLFTVFFTYKAALGLNLKNPLVASMIVIAAPLNFILTFSGLTEPLFALTLILAIWCVTRKNMIMAAIIISFSPFIRSEGLLFIAIFGLFFLLIKEKKPIIFLLSGHLLYSLAGYPVHQDIFWVFSKIPYATLNSHYGEGNLTHFLNQLYYVIGLPVSVLFWTGVIVQFTDLRPGKKNLLNPSTFLVFFGFIAFFIFHTLAWNFGLFQSMGLKRVLIGVMPLIALTGLKGFNILTENPYLKGNLKMGIRGFLVFFILIFPLIPNPASINWKRDMRLSLDQLAAKDAALFIRNEGQEKKRFFYAHPYLSEVLQIDHFDPDKRMDLNIKSLENFKSGDLLIWENWFSIVEAGMTQEWLEQKYPLRKIKEFRKKESDRESVFIIYTAK